jgi:hypothetical protein
VLAGTVVDLAGIALSVRATDAPRAEAVASLLRHACASVATPRCTLVFADGAPTVPDRAPTARTANADLWHEGPGALWIRSDDGLVASCDERVITIGGDAPALTREFRFVCLIALTHLLAQHGLHLVHGGAVVIDQRAVLVLGGTGTGKSTFAFAAHAQGLPVLADDAVIVRRGDAVVHASGVPRPISVGADVLLDAVHGGRPVPHDVRNRTELPPGTLATTVHPVVAVVVMAGDGARGSGLERMRGRDVLRMILQASASLADPIIRPELFSVAGMLARLPAWSLGHGTDPERAVDDATGRLEELTALVRAEGAEPGHSTPS